MADGVPADADVAKGSTALAPSLRKRSWDSLKLVHDNGAVPLKEALLADVGEKVVERSSDLEDAMEAPRVLGKIA